MPPESLNRASGRRPAASRRALLVATAVAMTCHGLTAPVAGAADEAVRGAGAPQREMAQNLGRMEVIGDPQLADAALSFQPVIVLTAEDIRRSGHVTIEGVLSDVPGAGFGLNALFNNGGNGSSEIELRHLGAARTLVLVNGRRWVRGTSGKGLGGAVDFTALPLGVVQRIEILKSGASSIYGSDAIAGVINVITRREFDGLQLSVQAGQYEPGDGTTALYTLTAGYTDAHWDVVFGASRYAAAAIGAGSRAISAEPRFGAGESRGSTITPQGRFVVREPVLEGGAYRDLTVAEADGRLDSFREHGRIFNYAPWNLLSTPSERDSAYLSLNRDLGRDVRLSFESLYSHRSSSQQLAPEPLVVSGAFNPGLLIPAAHPHNPFGYDLVGPAGVPRDDQGGILLLGRRLLEAGPRVFEQEVDTWSVATALEGRQWLGRRAIDWNASLSHAQSRGRNATRAQVDGERLAVALGPPDVCAAAPGCVPFDLFNGQGPDGDGTVTDEMLAYVLFDSLSLTENRVDAFSISGTSSLVDLPHGPVVVAAGYEQRREQGVDEPDPALMRAAPIGQSRQPTRGTVDVRELFLETTVPLVSGWPGAEWLELSAALRYSDYDTFGDTIARKLGLAWQPNEDWLIRATYSEGFRAPSVDELYGGRREVLTFLRDPCAGVLEGESPDGLVAHCRDAGLPVDGSVETGEVSTLVTEGSNPALEAEESQTLSAGIRYTPLWAPTLAVDVEWYRVDLDRTITSVGAQTILDACAYQGGQLCERVRRTPGGAIRGVVDAALNVGGSRVEGLDLGIDWRLPGDGWGELSLSALATYIDEFVERLPGRAGTTGAVSLAGRNPGDAGMPRWQGLVDARWQSGVWDATWRMRYVGTQTEPCSDGYDGTRLGLSSLGLCSRPGYDAEGRPLLRPDGTPVRPENELDDVLYHDLQLRYEGLGDGVSLSLGVHNLFDAGPPVSTRSFSNSFDPTLYEVPGRFLYVAVGWQL